MDNARIIALQALIKLEQDKQYSNILIDSMLSNSNLVFRDKAFATMLFYGVIERKLTLDNVISNLSNIKLEKISCDILNILRIGIYQLKFMDKVPDRAVVDESVKLVDFTRKNSAKGFVNAILREFIRKDYNLFLPKKSKDDILYYSIKYSCPLWLLKQFINDYGKEKAINFIKDSINRPPLYFKTNNLKTNSSELVESLKQNKIEVNLYEHFEDVFEVKGANSVEGLSQYKDGLFYVQDVASIICAKAVDGKPGEKVLDMCSAPGGKAFSIAQAMENSGEIVASDLHKNRLKLISDGANRLGINIIKTKEANGRIFDESMPLFDKVLCDVPCAGLGVIRRKPEIKYKSENDLLNLSQVQLDILNNGAKYLKEDGRLVYSTCSLSKNENEKVVAEFLKQNTDFSFDSLPESLNFINGYESGCVTLFPENYGSDGFFIAVFKRSKNV